MPLPTGNARRAVVRVCRSALLDMLMAAIESAVVPPLLHEHSERKLAAFNAIRSRGHIKFEPNTLPVSLLFSATGLPVAGVLFGREEVADGLSIFHVERMFPRSTNRNDWVFWDHERSVEVMAEVAGAAGAPFGIVGDFSSRSRLTETPASIATSRCYRLERTENTVPEFEGDRVALFMTVTRSTGTDPDALPPSGPAVHLRVGGWVVWLAALLRHRRMPTQGPTLVVEPQEPAPVPGTSAPTL